MSQSSRPRSPYQRTPTGLYVSEIAHPLYQGQRLRLSAESEHDLAEDRRIIREWAREHRRGQLDTAEFARRLERWERPRVLAAMLRGAWDRYLEVVPPSRVAKLTAVWRHQLAPQLGELAVVQLTALRLGAWERWCIAEGYAPKSTADAFNSLTTAVRGALRPGEDLPWRTAPGRYWRPSRKAVALVERPAMGTVDEAERVIGAALAADRDTRLSPRSHGYADLAHRVTVTLLVGLRNGELAGLGWDDLVLEGERPRVRVRHQAIDQWRRLYPEWTRPVALPKGHKERTIALHPTAILALLAQREQLAARGWYRLNGPVFPSPPGTPFAGLWRNNANGIRPEAMKRLAEAAGLPFPEEWVTHSLRHSLATLESGAGADLRSIQKRTGHGSLRVLEDYIHARTGRALAPTAVRELAVTFETHDTDRAPAPEEDDKHGDESD